MDKIFILYKAFDNVEDDMIKEAMECTKIKNENNRIRLILASVSGAAVICLFIGIFIVVSKTAKPYTCNQSLIELTAEQTTPDSVISNDSVEYIPKFRQPSIEKVYNTEPYSTLLPRYMLSGYVAVKTYQPLYDEEIHDSSFDPVYLELTFLDDSQRLLSDDMKDPTVVEENILKYSFGLPNLQINVYSKSIDENSGYHFADINDKKTYDLSLVPSKVDPTEYTAEELNEIYAGISFINCAVFTPEQITEEVIESRTKVGDNGGIFMIYIYSDGYIVDYSLICKDANSMPSIKELYKMVSSPLSFEK